MASSVDLAIRLTADAEDAEQAFAGVGDAALAMADDVDRATRDADASADRFGAVADSADNMASSSSQAAGGLGDLGGALSLMPGPLGAVGAGMEAVAPAIMGVTGAADLLNLVTESNIVLSIRQRAATIASAVASKAQAAATWVATGAQRAFNLAMAANPIGIAVLAATALIGLFVVLYKRSDRFRAIVDTVMGAAKAAIERVVDVLKVVGSWVKDKIPDAFRFMVKLATLQWRLLYAVAKFVLDKVVDAVEWVRDKALAVWQAIRDKGGAAWDWYLDKVRRVIDLVRGVIDRVRETVSNVADRVRDALGGAFDFVTDKVQAVLDLVQSIIDKVKDIDLPDLPDIPGFGRVIAGTSTSTAATVVSTGDTTVQITLPLLSSLSATDVARLIKALDDYYASRGLKVNVVPL